MPPAPDPYWLIGVEEDDHARWAWPPWWWELEMDFAVVVDLGIDFDGMHGAYPSLLAGILSFALPIWSGAGCPWRLWRGQGLICLASQLKHRQGLMVRVEIRDRILGKGIAHRLPPAFITPLDSMAGGGAGHSVEPPAFLRHQTQPIPDGDRRGLSGYVWWRLNRRKGRLPEEVNGFWEVFTGQTLATGVSAAALCKAPTV